MSPTPTPNPLNHTRVHTSMTLLQPTSKYKEDVAHSRPRAIRIKDTIAKTPRDPKQLSPLYSQSEQWLPLLQ